MFLYRNLHSSLLIFILPLIYDSFVSCNSIDLSHDCLVNYLRGENLDDEVFNKTAQLKDPLTDACKRRIKSESDLVFTIAHQRYEDSKEFKNELECFVDSIKSDANFKNLLLKKKAIELIKLSWKARLNPKNWISGQKKKALKAVEKQIKDIEFENYFVCEYRRKFTEAFDAIVDVEKLRVRKVDEEVCINKHLNISNNSSTSLNCEEVLKIRREEIFKNIHDSYADRKRSVKKCIDLSIMKDDYVAPSFRVYVFVSESNSQDSRTAKMNFVENMMELMKNSLEKCLK